MKENMIRSLVREEIRNLINDDTVFKKHDLRGLEKDFDIPGIEKHHDIPPDNSNEMSKSCETCGSNHTGACYDNGHDKKSSYMARPQLYRIAKYASDLLQMIGNGEEVDDWIESYIAQSEQMMNAIYGKLEYKNSKSHK
tara:strand:- start:303 stop:719 length:417 start_codon:yes stop_codon:yes gene_type:complete